MEKFVNEGDLELPQGRHCYEGDWSKMREPPPNGGALATMHTLQELRVTTYVF